MLSSTDTAFIGRKLRKEVKEESVEYSAEETRVFLVSLFPFMVCVPLGDDFAVVQTRLGL